MIAIAIIHAEMVTYQTNGMDPQQFASSIGRQRSSEHAQLAMSELSKVLVDRPEAAEVALMNCILFVLLDFMVGNFAGAWL